MLNSALTTTKRAMFCQTSWVLLEKGVCSFIGLLLTTSGDSYIFSSLMLGAETECVRDFKNAEDTLNGPGYRKWSGISVYQ